MQAATRNASEWFAKAQLSYTERHQGCPWCGGSHRVHQTEQGVKTTFRCQRCDFQVSFDAQTHRFQLIPGENLSEVSDTMLGSAIFQPSH